MPVFGGELTYTFDNKKTRVLVGNDFRDYLQFDRSTRFAVGHDFEGTGIVQFAILNASGFATEVWADPYLVGVSRKSTDLDVNGVRLTWDRILGSRFELELSQSERDVDDERSGESLDLTDAERKLLDRNGDITRVELGYVKQLNQQHALRPSIHYIDRDLDGDAMAQNGVSLELTHVFGNGRGFRWLTTVAFASLDAEEVNPVFGARHDIDRLTIGSTLFFTGALGLKNWTTNVGIIWGEEDSDIDFLNTEIFMFSAAFLRRF